MASAKVYTGHRCVGQGYGRSRKRKFWAEKKRSFVPEKGKGYRYTGDAWGITVKQKIRSPVGFLDDCMWSGMVLKMV